MLHVLNGSSADILWALNHSSLHRASFCTENKITIPGFAICHDFVVDTTPGNLGLEHT